MKKRNKNSLSNIFSKQLRVSQKLQNVFLAMVMATGTLVVGGSNGNLVAKDIHKAAKKGNVAKIEKILAAKKEDVNSLDKNGYSPLYYASGKGKLKAVQLLLKKGASVNFKNRGGATALHWASGNGKFEVTKLLIGNGANVHARKDDGYTPLHSACLGPTVYDFYAAQQTKTGKGRVKIVEYLLSKGAKPNAKDVRSWTPLNIVAYRQTGEGKYSYKIYAILEKYGGKLSNDVSKDAKL